MPHQCIHCNTIYDDGSREILHGCVCGSKFFFYLTAEKLAKIKNQSAPVAPLSEQEKRRIENDVRDIMGLEENNDAPVVLDFESIKVLKPGKYVLDLHNLFTKERVLLETVSDPGWFYKPQWISDTELQYTMPSGEVKIYKLP